MAAPKDADQPDLDRLSEELYERYGKPLESDEPLVGRMVTDRFTLILDHGRRLIVEP